MGKTPISRRRLLTTASAVSMAGLAGCMGGGGDADGSEPPTDERDRTLPEGAESCVSTMGVERESGGLSAKDDVDYQFHPNYSGASGFMEMCANCRFFCPGNQFGTEVGACAVVEGGIYSQDWCALWQAVDQLEERERSGSRGSQTDN